MSATECRFAWQNHLAPSINDGVWPDKENDQLITLALQDDLSWHDVAKHFPVSTLSVKHIGSSYPNFLQCIVLFSRIELLSSVYDSFMLKLNH